jgi:hypothetical protein
MSPQYKSDRSTKHMPAPGTQDIRNSNLPARASTQRTSKAYDNAPRRSYTPGVPARYPSFRNHVLGHLREHLSLAEILDARLKDLSSSQTQLTIGSKVIKNQDAVSVFGTFLEVRAALAEKLPALNQPQSYLFPALDGGRLFVSHRPQGMLEDGHKEFVESRDALFSFLFKYALEKDLDYFTSMTTFQLGSKTEQLLQKAGVIDEFKSLVAPYERARKIWCEKVVSLSKIIEQHERNPKSSRLNSIIKELEGNTSRGTELGIQLNELLQVKAALDLRHKSLSEYRSLPSHLKNHNLSESGDQLDPLDSELITPSIIPVFRPNPKLIFLGTDGGKIFGDTGGA